VVLTQNINKSWAKIYFSSESHGEIYYQKSLPVFENFFDCILPTNFVVSTLHSYWSDCLYILYGKEKNLNILYLDKSEKSTNIFSRKVHRIDFWKISVFPKFQKVLEFR